MQKRKEQDRQREKERRKQADIASQEQEQHKGKLEQASQARVECAVKAANDKHWSALFPNPQLGARHIVAYLGPTNSGKTWHALQALRGLRPHEHGVYLAPLRLLAIEVCEELRAQGVAASLITGEEQDRVPNANVVCSTIEMLDPQQHYAVAVIDEMQMIADIQRGWAWTQALFEMSADQLFVLGSPSVEPLLLDFAKSAGDSLTIHPTKRFTPLHLAEKPTLPKQVPPHSIYVVFSRNAVIRWSEYFRSNGHTVASI